MSSFLNKHKKQFDLKSFVAIAIKEDLGDGDHTSLSILSKQQIGKVKLLVKEAGIIAGVAAVSEILKVFSKRIKLKIKIKDGQYVKPGDVVFYLEGPVVELLSIERLLLNIMQRMSGIATKTNALQSLCAGTKARVIDTRKTTPGFRFFEKWAVLIGGGANHRFGLYDMILIKDNHVDFAGGIDKAILSAKKYLKSKNKKLPIELEVRNLIDIEIALKHKGLERLLLDNFSPSQTKKAVDFINGKIPTEASGGITEKNISLYAKAGVDFISVGALTHHIKSLDLSLKACDENY